MNTKELIRELPKGILKWYPFSKRGRALCVVLNQGEDSVITEVLEEAGLSVDRAALQELESETVSESMQPLGEGYDYIIAICVLEYANNPSDIVRRLYKRLCPSGRMLLGIDNRLAIRCFCGDRDPYTERNFDGIENYMRIGEHVIDGGGGRTYAKAEIREFLENAGACQYRFYSVFPTLEDPQILFADDYTPAEELCNRIMPYYHSPETVFLDEERLYRSLIDNDLFHVMANGFLVEAVRSEGADLANVNQVTISMERGREKALCTIIRRDGKVEKRALYPEGKHRIHNLFDNHQYLQSRGIPMVEAWLEDDVLVMPYIEAQTAVQYLQDLLREDKKVFLKELDRFWGLILQSSEAVAPGEMNWSQFEPGWERQKMDNPNLDKWQRIARGDLAEQESLGVILKRGYMDLNSINCFHTEEGFLFYDQETYMENVPAKAIFLRTVSLVHGFEPILANIITREDLQNRYKLQEYLDLYGSFNREYLDQLRNDKVLLEYHNQHRKNFAAIHSNRQRINYSTDEYLRLFVNIFSGLEDKKLFLFGSGNFTKKFLAMYGDEYEIAGVLDNNEARWGEQINGIEICSPSVLRDMSSSDYKIIICIKNYVSVLKQVRELGAVHIGIYDTDMEYPCPSTWRQRGVAARNAAMLAGHTSSVGAVLSETGETQPAEPKKYHMGYIAGVFDLFHIGHLNLFKRAKEQCDYLLVGVVSDEAVMNNKKTSPVVPEAERLEIVQACRYVDEAFLLPAAYGDTQDMYRKYHFDVQFSGSDYAEDAVWLEKQRFLRAHGAELVFFPYTESTSTTKRKEELVNKC